MSSFRVRPRFEDNLAEPPDAAHARLLAAFAGQPAPLEVKSFPGMIGLHIPETARRPWSPRLILSFEATETGATRISGTYGPEIEVWSVFLYGYLVSGMLGTFSGILGTAQLLLGQRPWGAWVCTGMVLLALLLYLGAQLGQKLGARQTFQLHQAYESAIGRPVEIQ